MTDELDLRITLKAPPGVHFYAGPSEGDAGPVGVCRRRFDGRLCGKPPEHRVHLRPPGDAPVAERKAATG